MSLYFWMWIMSTRAHARTHTLPLPATASIEHRSMYPVSLLTRSQRLMLLFELAGGQAWQFRRNQMLLYCLGKWLSFWFLLHQVHGKLCQTHVSRSRRVFQQEIFPEATYWSDLKQWWSASWAALAALKQWWAAGFTALSRWGCEALQRRWWAAILKEARFHVFV